MRKFVYVLQYDLLIWISCSHYEKVMYYVVVCVAIIHCRQRIEQEELDCVMEACDMVGCTE